MKVSPLTPRSCYFFNHCSKQTLHDHPNRLLLPEMAPRILLIAKLPSQVLMSSQYIGQFTCSPSVIYHIRPQSSPGLCQGCEGNRVPDFTVKHGISRVNIAFHAHFTLISRYFTLEVSKITLHVWPVPKVVADQLIEFGNFIAMELTSPGDEILSILFCVLRYVISQLIPLQHIGNTAKLLLLNVSSFGWI